MNFVNPLLKLSKSNFDNLRNYFPSCWEFEYKRYYDTNCNGLSHETFKK